MEPIDLNADTWERCERLRVYSDWFVDDDCPQPPSERKLRLLVVAALRGVWELLTEGPSRAAVEAIERYADEPNGDLLDRISDQAEMAIYAAASRWEDKERVKQAWNVALHAWQATTRAKMNSRSENTSCWLKFVSGLEVELPERSRTQAVAFHLALFHDLIANPFRPVAFDPSRQTSTVIALAEAIYADRAWDRMPILADALEEAGCDDARILDHCRTYPIHARGCWVVDLVLGKA